jgi:hypothetical protein
VSAVAYDAADWSDLFVASAGAAAALAGLLVVAVSINVERIVHGQGLPERALEALVTLLGALVASIVGLVPDLSRTALGACLTASALVSGAAVAALLVRRLPYRVVPARVVAGQIVIAAAGTLPFVIAGVSVLAEAGGGLYWTAGGIVGALVGTILNGWVLLVEILR